MPSQHPAYSRLPAWLLIIALLTVGSGWTLGDWFGVNTGLNTGVNTGTNTGYNFGYNSGLNSGLNYGVNTGYNGPGFCWSCPPVPLNQCGYPTPIFGWWYPFSWYHSGPVCRGLESVTIEFMGPDNTTVFMMLDGLPESEAQNIDHGLTVTLNATVMGLERLPDNLILVSNHGLVEIPLSCYELEAGQVYGDFGIVALKKAY